MRKKQNRVQFKKPQEAMLNSVERWGDDVDTAVKFALEELKADIEEVEVEILEEPTKGFFGIGAKLAKVRVTKKAKKEEPKEEKQAAKPHVGPIRKEEVTEEELNFDNGGRGKKEPSEKSGNRNRNRNKSRKSTGDSGKKEEKAQEIVVSDEPVIPTPDLESLTDLESHEGLEFLNNIIKEMGLEVDVKGKTDGKDLYFFMEGKDSGTIIGKRGATLDAIQYLTSLVVNKEGNEYIRVVVDAENYRAKREKSLEKLAIRLADKVVKTKRSYKLEPMNPYERKVIHATLQKDARIITRSEGQDPARRVVIELKG